MFQETGDAQILRNRRNQRAAARNGFDDGRRRQVDGGRGRESITAEDVGGRSVGLDDGFRIAKLFAQWSAIPTFDLLVAAASPLAARTVRNSSAMELLRGQFADDDVPGSISPDGRF